MFVFKRLEHYLALHDPYIFKKSKIDNGNNVEKKKRKLKGHEGKHKIYIRLVYMTCLVNQVKERTRSKK